MRPITDENRTQLLVELHRAITESADKAASRLAGGFPDSELTYPPNGRFTPDEIAALRRVALGDAGGSAIAKVVADATAGAVFRFFSVMDAVGDPEARPTDDVWLGAQLAEPDGEDYPMLHDAFFDSYSDFCGPSEVA